MVWAMICVTSRRGSGPGELSKLAVKLCHRRFGIGADDWRCLPETRAGRCVSLMPMDAEGDVRNALRSVARAWLSAGRRPEVAIGTGLKPATIPPEGEVRSIWGHRSRELLHPGGRRANAGSLMKSWQAGKKGLPRSAWKPPLRNFSGNRPGGGGPLLGSPYRTAPALSPGG